MAHVLLEGEYPNIVQVAHSFPLDEYLGHRFPWPAAEKKQTAVLISTENNQSAAKEISRENLAGSYAVMNTASLLLAERVAAYYFAPLAAVLPLMLPPVLRRNATKESAIEEATGGEISSELNVRQREVVTAIMAADKSTTQEHVIWGVTGSGKTRIYESLISSTLAAGQQALLLVPEIALSGQLLEVISTAFPGLTTLYHSGLADGERLRNYRRFLSGKARILVGTRSAVFVPAQNLGLILIDEEHDASFKDQRQVRFDTRTVARLRTQTEGVDGLRLILGSATPTLETLARAKSGAATLHRLRERATGQPLPKVFIPPYKPQHGLISPFLAEKMHEHLGDGNQVVLLMNRRGHSTHVHCTVCNDYAECPRCAVALTYHKDKMLRCHHCGHSEKYTLLCPRDQSERRLTGRGIQRVEEILETQFPAYEYARLDRDTAGRREFVTEVLSAMRAREIQILIGTQMIAKGFDLEGVTLVGVLAIDQTLNAPDFRASEHAWQLLSQVIGRSGRHRPGEVVVQSMAPNHAAIISAAEHNADAFYATEAEFRRLTHYPPFGSLAQITLLGRSESELFDFAEKVARDLQPANSQDLFATPAENTVEILGPAVPGLSKAEDDYRVHFLVKGKNENDLRSYLTRIAPTLETYRKNNLGIRIVLDIDPRSVG
jgi:primosomal protein N' (replication factor Y) (superfamily II helicase)